MASIHSGKGFRDSKRTSFNDKESAQPDFMTMHHQFETRTQELGSQVRKIGKRQESIIKGISENLHKLSQILKGQKTTREITEDDQIKEIKRGDSVIEIEVF